VSFTRALENWRSPAVPIKILFIFNIITMMASKQKVSAADVGGEAYFQQKKQQVS
jgi:hypothetical protein